LDVFLQYLICAAHHKNARGNLPLRTGRFDSTGVIGSKVSLADSCPLSLPDKPALSIHAVCPSVPGSPELLDNGGTLKGRKRATLNGNATHIRNPRSAGIMFLSRAAFNSGAGVKTSVVFRRPQLAHAALPRHMGGASCGVPLSLKPLIAGNWKMNGDTACLAEIGAV
jgi:hypothetical protein